LGLEELIEDGAILDHRGAKFFGGGVEAAVAGGDIIGEPVIFHDTGVGNGYIGGALLEGGLRITAGKQESVDKIVGFSDCGLGVIDEASLNAFPLDDEALALGGSEVADLEGFHAGFAVGKFCFGLLRGSVRDDGAIVFRSETILQGEGAGFAVLKVCRKDDGQDEDKRGYGKGDLSVRELKIHCVLLCGNVRYGKGLMVRLPGGGPMQPIMNAETQNCCPELLAANLGPLTLRLRRQITAENGFGRA
jgi:hypothetical protein